MAQKRNMSSTLKPDYFISHNGLPNILTTTRHVIRQSITTTTTAAAAANTTSSRNRINNHQKNSCPLTRDSKSQKNRQNLLEMKVVDSNKRPCLKKSEKDLMNYESKSSQYQGKLQRRLNNSTILSSPPPTSSSSQKFEADSECNQNIKRWFTKYFYGEHTNAHSDERKWHRYSGSTESVCIEIKTHSNERNQHSRV
jgi:hypothetical protein